jgi:hypothetical protein
VATMEISIVTPPGQSGSFTIGSRALMDPADPYHWMAIQGVVVTIIDEDDPIHGNMATALCATWPVAKYGLCIGYGQTEPRCLGTPNDRASTWSGPTVPLQKGKP